MKVKKEQIWRPYNDSLDAIIIEVIGELVAFRKELPLQELTTEVKKELKPEEQEQVFWLTKENFYKKYYYEEGYGKVQMLA